MPGIESVGAGRLIGHVGFIALGDEGELSNALAECARGRGLATQALDAACRRAFGAWALPSLLALTAADNLPSRRLLDRTGFVHLGDEERMFQGRPGRISRYRRAAPDPVRGPDGPAC